MAKTLKKRAKTSRATKSRSTQTRSKAKTKIKNDPLNFQKYKKLYMILILAVGLITAGLVYRSYAAEYTAVSIVYDSGNCSASGGTLSTETGSNSAKRNFKVCQITQGKTYAPTEYRHAKTKDKTYTSVINEMKSKGYTKVKTCLNAKSTSGTASVNLHALGLADNKTSLSITSGDYKEQCTTHSITGVNQNTRVAVISGTIKISSMLFIGQAKTPTPPPSGYGTYEKPFSANSIWNTPLASTATFDNSSTTPWSQSTQFGAGLSYARSWGHPLYVGKASDNLYTATIGNFEDWEAYGPNGIGAHTAKIRIPSNADRSGGLDGGLAIYDETTGSVWEFYMGWNDDNHVNHSNKTLYAGYAVRQDITSDGLQGGTRAYGGSGIAGLIRQAELNAGVINHKMAMMVHRSVLNANGKGFTWPASRKDGFPYEGYASWAANMGESYAIPRSVDINAQGLGTYGKIVAKALQDYGGIVVDQSDARSLGSQDLSVTWELSSSDAHKIALLLRKVTSISESNPSGAR